jgi:hypothetical protein
MKTKTTPDKPATKTVSTPTAVENNALTELEAAFEVAYKATGAIWAQIRVSKLYAPAFGSFADYCNKRWRNRSKVLWKSVLDEAMKGAEKPAKAPKKAAAAPAPTEENHLPPGKTLAQAVGLDPAPATKAPAKPRKKAEKHSHEPGGPGGAAEQVRLKKESLGQLKNRARMAKGETRAKLIAQIAREHGAAAAADLVPGEATEVPGVNNLPAVGVVA